MQHTIRRSSDKHTHTHTHLPPLPAYRATHKASLERYRRSTAEILQLLHRLVPAAVIEKARCVSGWLVVGCGCGCEGGHMLA
jgi:hypothetical protein